jgi:chemotaxis protein CheD
MSDHDIHVKMCELRTGSGPQVLRTILGSCVGIGLLWRGRDLCGLAHCLLPEPPATAAMPATSSPAKYVTAALPSLLQLMGAKSAHHGELEAVIAGGACMVHQAKPAPYGLIGEQNVQMAKRLLAEAGIRLIHTDTGGASGRQLCIDCGTQAYAVRLFEPTY